MAEAAAIAPILGITGFGMQLTKDLYIFGSDVSSATEQTSYIARHIDLYANVLDVLAERIGDEEPILSTAAIDLIAELAYQSRELFTTIAKSLPSRKKGKDDISFLQKVKWSFTKSKVVLLVGEINYLRSTVHLLATIVFTGNKIRSHRKKRGKSAANGDSDVDNDLRQQGIKAQNALLAHHAALEKLPELEKEVQQEESSSRAMISSPASPQPNISTDIICTSTSTFAELHQSLQVSTDPAERQRAVLERSTHLLQQLLKEWTNIEPLAPERETEEQQAQSSRTPVNSQRKEATSPAKSPPLSDLAGYDQDDKHKRKSRVTRTEYHEMHEPARKYIYEHSDYDSDDDDITYQQVREFSKAYIQQHEDGQQGTPHAGTSNVPPLPRSKTVPSLANHTHGREKAAPRTLNLKQPAEIHNSGYASPGQFTPVISGVNSTKQNKNNTRNQIVDEYFSRGHRTNPVEPGDQHRRSRSPAGQVGPGISKPDGRGKPSRSATTAFPSCSTEEPPTVRRSSSRHKRVSQGKNLFTKENIKLLNRDPNVCPHCYGNESGLGLSVGADCTMCYGQGVHRTSDGMTFPCRTCDSTGTTIQYHYIDCKKMKGSLVIAK